LEKLSPDMEINRENDGKSSSESFTRHNLMDNVEKELFIVDPSTSEELRGMISPQSSSNLNATSNVIESTFQGSKVESIETLAKSFSKSSWDDNFKALAAYKYENGHINLKTVSDFVFFSIFDKASV
jgi:hypothetical protein